MNNQEKLDYLNFFGDKLFPLNNGYVFFPRRIEISKKGEAYKMIIKGLTEDDAGEYECMIGERSTKCQITVEERKLLLDFHVV